MAKRNNYLEERKQEKAEEQRLAALKGESQAKLNEKVGRKTQAAPTLQEILDSRPGWVYGGKLPEGPKGGGSYFHRIKIKALGRVIHVHTSNNDAILCRAHVKPKIREQEGDAGLFLSCAQDGKFLHAHRGTTTTGKPRGYMASNALTVDEYGYDTEDLIGYGMALRDAYNDSEKYEHIFYNNKAQNWWGKPAVMVLNQGIVRALLDEFSGEISAQMPI